ncbi:MAG: hypothetical protein JSW09_08020 [Pseudomonadota bacterium]|nr:MAG: hypothetical protein JSW09_08020 [Pseudomonadota bacterium]
MTMHLMTLVDGIVSAVGRSECVVTNRANGAVLCFLVDPQDALTAAVSLRDRLLADLQRGVFPATVSFGIHLGPVSVAESATGPVTVAGDGIHNAEMVTAAASPGQILVSQTFHEAIANVSHDYCATFHDAGQFKDSLQRDCRLYSVAAAPNLADTVLLSDAPRAHGPSTQMISDQTGWERAELTAAAIAMEPYVGNRARELVQKAAERAASVADLYRLLVDSLPPAARPAFRRAHAIDDGSSASGAVSSSPTAKSAASPLHPTLLQVAERQLAVHFGPLARVLVKKHADEHVSSETFIARLANELPDSERAAFIAAIRKLVGAGFL